MESGPRAAAGDVLLRSIDNSILTLTLNRPEKLNAMTWRMMRLLREAVEEAAADPGVNVVVLTGAGRGFCSGGDLRGEPDPDDPINERWRHDPVSMSYEQRVAQLQRATIGAVLLYELPKPTIAMIRGPVAGSGLCIAAACDFRLAAPDCAFTTAFINAARPGDFGGSYFLPRLVGQAKARELYMLGTKIDAEEALRIGLITKIVAAEELESETTKLAQQLARGPCAAYRYMKRALSAAETRSAREVQELEAAGMIRCSQTDDAKELIKATKESRRPTFKGY